MSPVARPTRDQVLVFETAAEMRAWFEANHDTATEAFIGYYRRGVAKQSTTWVQAVEEALCFGWIDGITFRIDDEVTANRFTPRRPTSNWSAVNITKIAELRSAGRMHPNGDRAFEERDRRKDQRYSYEQPPQPLPAEWTERFQADAEAWAYWEGQTPSYRHVATHWVMSAIRPETRERRLATLIEASRAGSRPHPFLVPRRSPKRAP
ncbi:MAG: YdeI/OmpD-associated family protein [Candidatus Limnocylindria bacterium]